MTTAFLLCALALPVPNKRMDYMLFKQFIETRWPEYWCVFVNENEKLSNPDSIKTHIYTVMPLHKEALRMYLIRRSA